MKNIIISLLLLLAVSTVCIAQESAPSKQRFLKLYNQANYSTSSKKLYTCGGACEVNEKEILKSLTFFHPTFAYQWRKDSLHSQEIELTNYSISEKENRVQSSAWGSQYTDIGGHKILSFDFAVRYEFQYGLKKLSGKKLQTSIGVGGSPYFERYIISPFVSTEYRNAATNTGLKLFVTPRLTYSLTDRVYFDLNIPFCLADLHAIFSQNENPSIPIELRRTSEVNFDAFPKFYSVRFGVGVKI